MSVADVDLKTCLEVLWLVSFFSLGAGSKVVAYLLRRHSPTVGSIQAHGSNSNGVCSAADGNRKAGKVRANCFSPERVLNLCRQAPVSRRSLPSGVQRC